MYSLLTTLMKKDKDKDKLVTKVEGVDTVTCHKNDIIMNMIHECMIVVNRRKLVFVKSASQT